MHFVCSTRTPFCHFRFEYRPEVGFLSFAASMFSILCGLHLRFAESWSSTTWLIVGNDSASSDFISGSLFPVTCILRLSVSQYIRRSVTNGNYSLIFVLFLTKMLLYTRRRVKCECDEATACNVKSLKSCPHWVCRRSRTITAINRALMRRLLLRRYYLLDDNTSII